MVKTHTYAHPLHMKVVKLCMHVCHWFRSPLEWVHSLNYLIIMWFCPLRGNQFWLISLRLRQGQQREQGRTLHVHIHNIKMLWNNTYMIKQWCGSPFDWFYSLINLTMLWFVPQEVTRFVVGNTNSLANESRGNSVRTSSTYAHPQLIIFVKHLMWELTWMGLPPQLPPVYMLHVPWEISKVLAYKNEICNDLVRTHP